jgi:hypothetical protein
MRRPYLVFVGLLVLGFLAATTSYRTLQTAAPAHDIAHIDLTEAQKKLLESRDSMSKWLLGLAYGALAGLLGLRFKDQNSLQLDTTLPMAACGLLVLSLYGAFLFQDSMMFSLSKGPIYHIYGSLMDFPLQMQFWTLVAALILLALWLFRPPKKYTVTLSVFLALSFAARAQDQASVGSVCLSDWEKGREMRLTQTGRATAAAILEKLAQRAGLRSPAPCDYTMSLLDELRWDAYVVKQDDSTKAMESYLKTIDQELRKPGLSMGEVVTKLVTISQVWRGASGLLIVESQTKGTPILLDGTEAGMTTGERRLAPGTYSVDVVRGGRTVYSNRKVRIEDGKECRIDIDARP